MKLALWAQGPYAADGMFDASSPVNRDDGASAYRDLQAAVTAHGGQFHTLDIYESRGEHPDVVLFLEAPNAPVRSLLSRHPNARAWVVLLESEVVLARNWDTARHAEFERVFTWNDSVVDNDRYFKLNFPNPMHRAEPQAINERMRDFALIAGNKSSPHPLELYSERVATIRWFEAHAPDRFDLYGNGWQASAGAGPLRRRANALLNRLGGRTHFPSWRGRVDSKLEVLRDYRFGICYENAHGIPGYITEKLFDCLAAGTIPIYWGPPNAADLLNQDAYVDRANFADTGELVAYLDGLDDDQLGALQAAGQRFLDAGAALYTNAAFVQTLLHHVDAAQFSGTAS